MFSTDAMLHCVFTSMKNLAEKESELNYLLYLFLSVGMEVFAFWRCLSMFPVALDVFVRVACCVPISRLFSCACARDALVWLCVCVCVCVCVWLVSSAVLCVWLVGLAAFVYCCFGCVFVCV